MTQYYYVVLLEAVQISEENSCMISILRSTKAAFKAAFLFIFLTITVINLGCNNQAQESNKTKLEKTNTFKSTDEKKGVKNSDALVDDVKPKVSLLLSLNFSEEKTKPQSNFDCDQKIFAVLLLENYPNKLHNIVVNWLDPYNKQRESTEIPTFISKDQVYTWSSLSLHRDVTAGMLQWINPAAGMEEFIGEWQVKVLIENELVQSEKFTVVC